MPTPKPFVETEIKGGVKRTYWYEADVRSKDRALKKESAAAASKRGKRYSRSDQQKIVAEKWQEICEKRRPPQEC